MSQNQATAAGGWHSVEQALAVAREANDLLREEILQLRSALRACHTALTDQRIGTADYMEGSEIYNDFKRASDIAEEALNYGT